MRSIEQQQIALECAKLAVAYNRSGSIIDDASALYAFVTGEAADDAADDAKAKLAAIRAVVTPPAT